VGRAGQARKVCCYSKRIREEFSLPETCRISGGINGAGNRATDQWFLNQIWNTIGTQGNFKWRSENQQFGFGELKWPTKGRWTILLFLSWCHIIFELARLTRLLPITMIAIWNPILILISCSSPFFNASSFVTSFTTWVSTFHSQLPHEIDVVSIYLLCSFQLLTQLRTTYPSYSS